MIIHLLAKLYACGANSKHGLLRSNEDKRKAVRTLLQDAEWSVWSDRDIATRCNVSPTFVDDLRKKLTVHVDSEDKRTYTTKHGTAATMQTANIGKSSGQKQDVSLPELPAPPSNDVEVDLPAPKTSCGCTSWSGSLR